MSSAHQPMPGVPDQNKLRINLPVGQMIQGRDYFNSDHATTTGDIPSYEKISAAANVHLGNFMGTLTPTDELNSISFPILDPMQSDYLSGFGLGIDDQGLMPNVGNGSVTLAAHPMAEVAKDNRAAQQQAPRTPSKKASSGCHLITPDPTPTAKRYIDVIQGRGDGMIYSNQNAFDTSLWTASQESDMSQGAAGATGASGTVTDGQAPPSPPGTGCMLSISEFDMAVMPDPNSLAATSVFDMDFSDGNTAAPSPTTSAYVIMSPTGSPVTHSPELAQEQTLNIPVNKGPTGASAEEATNNPPTYDGVTGDDVQIEDESNDGIQPLDVTACMEPTGITWEEIALYMQGPDPSNGRWVCTYPNCNWKPFERKENAKCHVQTHLQDRKYKCPGCPKRFVREHDLKRHWKIHTGNKPFKCDCEKTFNRQDALTRHRNRGSCVGAFSWATLKKKGPRGRPRKNPQDPAQRKEKKQRIRKNAKSAKDSNKAEDGVPMSASSSSSGTSISSYQQSSSPVDEGFNNGGPVPISLLGQGLDGDLLNMTQGTLGVTPPPTPKPYTSSNTGMTSEEEYCFSESSSPVPSAMEDVMANFGGNAVLLPSAYASPTMASSALQPIHLVHDTAQASPSSSGPTSSNRRQVDLTDPVAVLEMYFDLDQEPPVIETTNRLMLDVIDMGKKMRERYMAERMEKLEAGDLFSS